MLSKIIPLFPSARFALVEIDDQGRERGQRVTYPGIRLYWVNIIWVVIWGLFFLHLALVLPIVCCGGKDVKRLVKEPRSTVIGRHSKAVKCVVFSPKGKAVVSSDSDGTVKIWDVASQKQRHALKWGNLGGTLSFSPDGRLLATGGYESKGDPRSDISAVAIWKGLTGKQVTILKGYGGSGAAFSVDFSPDGRILAVGSKRDCLTKACMVFLWDIPSWKLRGYPEVDMGIVTSLKFSPDGKTLAVGGIADDDKTPILKLLEVATKKVEAEYKGMKSPIFSVAFSPDGKVLASGGGNVGEESGEVALWNVVQGKRQATLKGLRGTVAAVSFSHDGNLLVTGGGNHLFKNDYAELKLWDTKTLKELVSLKGHSDMVRSVAFSHDDRMLVSGSYDGTVRLWYLRQPAKGKRDR